MRPLALVLALSSTLGGCAAGFAYHAHEPGIGVLYSNDVTNLDITDHPIGNKKGEACATSILGLVTRGDASVQTAARNAGIDQIGVIDQRHQNILGVYAVYCVVVYGE